MIYRTIGASAVKVSVIGLGTWQFGGEWGKDFTPKQVAGIFDAARANGITLVDTAECYGDHLSEKLVGGAIHADRDRWVVATKFGHGFKENFERDQKWSVDEVRSQLELSLRALDVEAIDLYQFHSGTNEAFGNDKLWKMLEEQKRLGKIRHLGISISGGIPPEHKVDQARRAREVGAECLQVVYNRLERWPEETLLPVCRDKGLGFLARVPLASGFLSGKFREDQSFAASDHRSKKPRAEIKSMAAEAARIRAEEVPAGVTMAAWALAWCLKTPGVTAVIPGSSSPEQVAQNAAAAGLL